MTDATDHELLRDFAASRSDDAFAQLVARHVDKVYTAARRQVRDPARAQDITQAVFVALARKAHAIDRRVAIAGWLIKATHLAARDLRRAEARRQKHERHAAELRSRQMSAQEQPHAGQTQGDDWERIVSLLDESLAALSDGLRDAIVLRFFEGRDFHFISESLGISQEAARKRVERGLCRLRGLLSHRGAGISNASLAALLTTHGVSAAPAGIGASVTTGALAAAHSAFAKGAITAMAWSKLKVAAACAVGLLALGGGAVITHHLIAGANASQTLALGQTPSVAHVQAIPGTGNVKVRGVVRTADGKPVTGGQAIAMTARDTMLFGDPSFARELPGPNLRADIAADGSFEIVLPKAPDAVCAECPEGFVAVKVGDLSASAQLEVVPWASVHGTVFFHGRPVAGSQIMLASGAPNLQWRINMLTDQQGRFAIPRAPSGLRFLSCNMPGGQFINGMLRIDPGTAATVDFGALTGRRVTAQLQTPNLTGDVTVLLGPDRTTPANPSNGHFELDSYQANFQYPQSPGFAFDDVPPGHYRLNITLRDSHTFALLATAERQIVVPPGPETGDAPLLTLDPIALKLEARKGRE